MNKKHYCIIFYALILLSIVCLLFAGFAPMVFTLASSGIDFTQTGTNPDRLFQKRRFHQSRGHSGRNAEFQSLHYLIENFSGIPGKII